MAPPAAAWAAWAAWISKSPTERHNVIPRKPRKILRGFFYGFDFRDFDADRIAASWAREFEFIAYGQLTYVDCWHIYHGNEGHAAMIKTMPITEFMKLFPDDDACLEHLFRARFGVEYKCKRCGDIGLYKRLSKLPAYTCSCGEHVHPMVGTPFFRSHTPLQKWFYAMYLFTTTRHGVPAKELQRQLSVNYKTAYRMGMQIRKYLAYVDADPPLGGHVEIDETLVGGKHKGGGSGRNAQFKTIVLGMVERNGDVITRVIPNVSRKTLEAHIIKHVKRETKVTTDEFRSYKRLWMYGYDHDSVNHAAKEYARGDRHTNTIEGFWSIIKRSIHGTHVHVSSHRLPLYLGEFEFRWNLRHRPEKMFPTLLRRLSTSLPEGF